MFFKLEVFNLITFFLIFSILHYIHISISISTMNQNNSFFIRSNYSENTKLILQNAKNTNCLHKSTLISTSIANLQKISKIKEKQKENKAFLQSEMSQKKYEKALIRNIDIFEMIKEGSHGKVFKATLVEEYKCIALKKVQIDNKHANREKKMCETLRSQFLVKVLDVFEQQVALNKRSELSILMQLYEYDLKQYLGNAEYIDCLTMKILIYQMVRSLLYLHSKQICHRDIKPDNFLIKNHQKIVLSDFGSAKHLHPGEFNVNYVCSRPYRAPQLLLGSHSYDKSIDIWSLGCIIAEIILKKPLFESVSVIDHLLQICRILGTKQLLRSKIKQTTSMQLPQINGKGFDLDFENKMCPLLLDLMKKMLKIVSSERVSAVEALTHPYFDELREEEVFKQIEKEWSGISSFFIFSKDEMKQYEHLQHKLVPKWLQNQSKAKC